LGKLQLCPYGGDFFWRQQAVLLAYLILYGANVETHLSGCNELLFAGSAAKKLPGRLNRFCAISSLLDFLDFGCGLSTNDAIHWPHLFIVP
jgi:hypothetical protein